VGEKETGLERYEHDRTKISTVKIAELRDTYYEATDKVSELVRQLSFAGIAVVWILRTGEHAGGVKYSSELLRPLVFFVGTLSCDLLQYLYKSVVYGLLNRYYWRRHHDNKADVRVSPKWNWLTLVLFWLKVALVIIAYGYLLNFMWGQLRLPAYALVIPVQPA
jgi:hypothetical protein